MISVSQCSLITARLHLNQLQPADLDNLICMFRDERVSYFPYGRARAPEEVAIYLQQELLSWSIFGYGRFGLRLADDGRFVGVVGPRCATWPPQLLPSIEIGWRIVPSYWHQGMATEAATAVVEWLAHRQFSRLLVCIYEPANTASRRVAAKLGMHKWGCAVHPAFERQMCIDVLELSSKIEQCCR